MTLTLSPFRKPAPAIPQPGERADLEQQRDEIDAKLRALDEAELLAKRAPLVAELKTLSLPDCPRLRELERKIKDCPDPEALLMFRQEWNKLNADRVGKGYAINQRRDAIRLELLESAPPEISAHIERLEVEIRQANGATKSSSGGGMGGTPLVRQSNAESIRAFVVAAREAQRQLSELTFLALDATALQKTMSKILKPVPVVDFALKVVSK